MLATPTPLPPRLLGPRSAQTMTSGSESTAVTQNSKPSPPIFSASRFARTGRYLVHGLAPSDAEPIGSSGESPSPPISFPNDA